MVFQNYALYPHMDVYNNMAFGLKLRKFPKPEIDRRVKEAAKIWALKTCLTGNRRLFPVGNGNVWLWTGHRT